jgi:nucleoside-diphosphate-sugar epimerase
LGAVLQDLVKKGHVEIGEDPQSAKDYISIDDVVTMLPQIAEKGGHRIYNLARGKNTSHAEIADILTKSGYNVSFRKCCSKRVFPRVDVSRLTDEFDYAPRDLSDDLPLLMKAFENLYGFANTGDMKK